MLCQWRAHGSKCVLCAQTGGAMKRTVDSQVRAAAPAHGPAVGGKGAL